MKVDRVWVINERNATSVILISKTLLIENPFCLQRPLSRSCYCFPRLRWPAAGRGGPSLAVTSAVRPWAEPHHRTRWPQPAPPPAETRPCRRTGLHCLTQAGESLLKLRAQGTSNQLTARSGLLFFPLRCADRRKEIPSVPESGGSWIPAAPPKELAAAGTAVQTAPPTPHPAHCAAERSDPSRPAAGAATRCHPAPQKSVRRQSVQLWTATTGSRRLGEPQLLAGAALSWVPTCQCQFMPQHQISLLLNQPHPSLL